MAKEDRDRKRLEHLTELIKEMEIKMLVPELKAMRIWREIVMKQVEDEIDSHIRLERYKEGTLH